MDSPPRRDCQDPADRTDEKLDTIVPDRVEQALRYEADHNQRRPTTTCFCEVHQHFAQNIVVGFARLAGRSVGVVANQPAVLAGCLDIDASIKAARFVRFCDAFNIPLITFEDVPGFFPASARNLAESLSMELNCCTLSLRPPFPKSLSSLASLTAALIASWRPSIFGPIWTLLTPLRRLQSWALRER